MLRDIKVVVILNIFIRPDRRERASDLPWQLLRRPVVLADGRPSCERRLNQNMTPVNWTVNFCVLEFGGSIQIFVWWMC